ncbi:MAG: nuclear transport factor 2 family protein [Endomicrobiales bacterium]
MITAPSTRLSNREKAVAVLKSLETGDRQAVEACISPGKYIQHNLSFPTGREALLNALEEFKKADTRVTIHRTIEDGGCVALHSSYDSRSMAKAAFDVFRFEDGLIVEHWDNLQDRIERTPGGHTMLDGPSEITGTEKTEENRQRVKDFIEAVLIGNDGDAAPAFFDDDRYIQHNPRIPDGLTGLAWALEALSVQGLTVSYEKLHMLLCQGDFVLAASEGYFGRERTSFYDLFRVQDGKLAEHWDTMQAIPPKAEWKNDNGKF